MAERFGDSVERLAARHPALVWAVTLGLSALVIAGDVITGAEVLFTPLYFAAIALGGWYRSRGLAGVVAVLATITWLAVDLLVYPQHSTTLVGWNLVVQASVFATVAVLVPRLRSALTLERIARVTAERDLEHAQRLTVVGRVAAGVAHELGTALSVAGTYSRMIADGSVQGPEAVRAAQSIAGQVQAMTGIIRQMLDFARPEHPRRAPQSLTELVKGSVGLLAPVVKERRVELRFLPPATPLPDAEVDGGQLRQVVSNLIMNAVQASPHDSVVEVGVEAIEAMAPADLHTDQHRWFRVSVRDHGPGIAAEVLPRIFEPFFTTKPVGEGSGLGLAVAWGLARENGGWIAVETALGQGTTFSVHLPRGS